MIIRKTILDLPLERQKEMSVLMGYSSFDEWKRVMQQQIDRSTISAERFFNEDNSLSREEAEELIADIINNPEDKVGFAQRMAVDPDSVTAEKMIANIRARIRD